MSRYRSLRSATSVLVTLAAVVLASSTLGRHAGPEAVGPPTLEPMTLYVSEHRSEGNETHLHAEIGFESILCLACFSSLRNQTHLANEPGLVAMSVLGTSAPIVQGQLPASPPAHAFSPRAPPRA